MLEEAYGVSLTAGRITYAEIFSCKYNLTFPHSLNLMIGGGVGLVLVVFCFGVFFFPSQNYSDVPVSTKGTARQG